MNNLTDETVGPDRSRSGPSPRKQVWSAVEAALNTLMRDLDPHLNLIHLKTLVRIAWGNESSQPLEIRDVVKETGLDRRAVSRALKLLGPEGSPHKRSLNLVQMDTAKDHRTRTVRLSPRGLEVAEQIMGILTRTITVEPQPVQGLSAPVAVIVTNNNGKIRWVSTEFTKLWGFSYAEVYNRKPSELLHGPLTETAMHHKLKQGVAARVPVEATITNYRKDGCAQRATVEIRPVDEGSESGFLALSKLATS